MCERECVCWVCVRESGCVCVCVRERVCVLGVCESGCV